MGLDFAGPLYLRKDNSSHKAYVLFLTCASTRALHLELSSDMSVDKFLMACPTQFTLIMTRPFTQPIGNYRNFVYSSRIPRPHDTLTTTAYIGSSLLHGRPGGEDGRNEWSALQNGAYERFWDIDK